MSTAFKVRLLPRSTLKGKVSLVSITTQPADASIEFVADGGGATLTTGLLGFLELPFDCVIEMSTLLSDQNGSLVVDVWRCTYGQFDGGLTHPVAGDSITGATPPTIVAATKAQDSSLVDWSPTLFKGDVIAFNINSVSGVKRATLSLDVSRGGGSGGNQVQSNLSFFETRTAAIAADIISSVTWIETLGYSTLGDGGGGVYIKVGADPGVGGFQSTDGAWWELSEPFPNVLQFGATGNGVNNDTAAIQRAIDFCFGTAIAPHSKTNSILNRPLRFPKGLYITSTAAIFTQVVGGLIHGDGRIATIIKNTGNGNVIKTNGCARTKFADMRLWSTGTGVAFDLDWDNTGLSTLQSNTLSNVQLGGDTLGDGDIGLRIGFTGFMGSETEIENCFIANFTTAGVKTCNFNALSNSLIGGDIQNCGIGVWANAGTVPLIDGTGFQLNTLDIQIDNSVADGYVLNAVRSESDNFLSVAFAQVMLNGCLHKSNNLGRFIEASSHARVTATDSWSVRGDVHFSKAIGTFNDCGFSRDDWCAATVTGANGVLCNQVSIGNTQYGGPGTLNRMLWRGMWDNFDSFFVPFGPQLMITAPDGPGFTEFLQSSTTLTDAANIATDASVNTLFDVTLTANRTLDNPTNLYGGQTYIWKVKQGVGGNHTLAYGAKFTWPGGVPPVLSLPAGSIDIITAIYDDVALKLRATFQLAYS